MSSKSRPKPAPVKKAAAKSAAAPKTAMAANIAKTAVSLGASALGIGGSSRKSGGKRRSRKKSALFYAREIQRLKLKKKYEKIKLGLMR